MTGNTQHFAQHLFKAGSLDEVSVAQIENLCNQYPFFNVGHYLLSKKLHTEKADGFLTETKKTALYFNNPFWLQWLLQNPVNEPEHDVKKAAVHEDAKTESLATESTDSITESEKIPVSDNALQITDKTLSATTKQDDLLFSPYHTVDYFASLGIKLMQEENPNDKFGRQLKSFTEWIKTMKRLPQKNAEASTDIAAQAAIEGFAAHSLQQREIITEAMADVLAKQGKNENAIELYQKLSLLNPSKSAYFAAKIEQLKEH